MQKDMNVLKRNRNHYMHLKVTLPVSEGCHCNQLRIENLIWFRIKSTLFSVYPTFNLCCTVYSPVYPLPNLIKRLLCAAVFGRALHFVGAQPLLHEKRANTVERACTIVRNVHSQPTNL